jgi:CBS domain-containing protein
VQQAARAMRESDTGALPVGESDRLVGMVTDRDVTVRLVAEGGDPARTKVRDVMTPEVRYVFEDEDLEYVADNMAQQQVRRLPVMNRQKRLIGVVSLGNIAKGRRSQLAGRALQGIAREGGQHAQTAAE